MNPIFMAVLAVGLTGLQAGAGEYLVLYKQHMIANATPATVECDSMEVWHAYSKLIISGKPAREVRSGAIIAVVAKKDFAKLGQYSRAYPALKPILDEIESRWSAEVVSSEKRTYESQKSYLDEIEGGESFLTLDGKSFKGIVRASNAYTISITTADGMTSLKISELSANDLKKWNTIDRKEDGRFWYERTLAIIKAQDAGLDVTDEAKEAREHFEISNAYLTQLDRDREARRKAQKKLEETAKKEADGRESTEFYLLREDSYGNEMMFDRETGEWFYTAPLLRKIFQ